MLRAAARLPCPRQWRTGPHAAQKLLAGHEDDAVPDRTRRAAVEEHAPRLGVVLVERAERPQVCRKARGRS